MTTFPATRSLTAPRIIAALVLTIAVCLTPSPSSADSGGRQPSTARSQGEPERSELAVSPQAPATASGDVSAKGRPLKPVMRGLVLTKPQDLKMLPYAKFATIKSLDWADVEPKRGTYDFSKITKILKAHPKIKFRLRIYGGRGAPQWLKGATGGCVQVEPDSPNGNSGCIARYWQKPYLEAYRGLMRALANKFDDHPQIVDVANSACTTIYAEPLILGADDASIDRLWRAGLNRKRHRQCLVRSTAIMMNQFDHTRVSIAGHHKWQYIVQGSNPRDGRFESSWTAARRLFNEFRYIYGDQVVIEDHGLRASKECSVRGGQDGNRATSFYCYMAGLKGWTPRGWQFTLNGESMSKAAWAGVRMNACYLEFAAFWELGEAERRNVHQALIDNCVY